MKKYKVVKVNSSESFETSLNELAAAGWKVLAANFTHGTSENAEPIYFALLENIPLETEIKHLLEENPEELDNIGNLGPSAN